MQFNADFVCVYVARTKRASFDLIRKENENKNENTEANKQNDKELKTHRESKQ